MLKRDSLPAVFAGHSEALGPAALQGALPPHILTGITGEISSDNGRRVSHEKRGNPKSPRETSTLMSCADQTVEID